MKTKFFSINLLKTFIILLCIFTMSCSANIVNKKSDTADTADTADTDINQSYLLSTFLCLEDSSLISKNSYNEFKAKQTFENFSPEISLMETSRNKVPINDELFTNFNTEEYDHFYENRFRNTLQNPLSTYSIDVDTASYSNIRRFIQTNHLPPKDAVRIEEMLNYFSYSYPFPKTKHPFSITTELSDCPWNINSKLIHIGLKGMDIDNNEIKPSNLVFLIDSSGSMQSNNKLPLVKKAFMMLVKKLRNNDKIAIVTYAGNTHLVLQSTEIYNRNKIISALHRIKAGGSTSGNSGIQMAYDIAEKNFIHDGNNRVILATDGDFNVGISSTGALVRLIEEKRKNNIYLTICGFGMGNYKDGKMEQISNAGNGNYYYIDNINEAKKFLLAV